MSALAEAFVDIKPTPDSLGKGITDEINKAAPGAERASGQLGARIGGVFSGIGRQIGGEFGELFTKLGEGIDHVAENGKKLGAVLGAGGGVAAGLGLALQHIGSADKQASDQLKAAITATGNSFADYKDRIEEAVKSGEKYAHTAPDTLQALQAITQATQDPTKAFKDLALVEDLAAAKHESLAAAAQQIALVYAGSTRLLKQYGITTKDVDEALTQLAAKLHGQAAASVDNFDGKVNVAKARVEDWVAALGQKLGPALTLAGTAATIASGAVEVFAVAAKRAAAANTTVMASLLAMSPVFLAITAALAAATGGFLIWQHQQAVAAAHAKEFADAIKQDNGALGDNTQALIANRLAGDGAFNQALKLGISQKELTDALLGNSTAMGDVRSKIALYNVDTGRATQNAQHATHVTGEQAQAARALGSTINGVSGDIRKGAEENRQYALATADGADSTFTMNQALNAFPEASARNTAKTAHSAWELAKQTREAAREAAHLSHQWDILTGKLSNDEAENASAQSILDLAKQLRGVDKNGKDASTSFSRLTERGIANRQAVDDSIRSFQEQARVLQDGTVKGNKAAATSYDQHYEALRKTLREAGVVPGVIDDLIGAYKHIPNAKVTHITADTHQARNAIADLLVQLQHVPRSVAIGISAKVANGTAGASAAGGPVYAGETREVGEFGKETVTFGQNGWVTPAVGSGKKGGGVHIENLHVDASGTSNPAAVQQAVHAGITAALDEVMLVART